MRRPPGLMAAVLGAALLGVGAVSSLAQPPTPTPTFDELARDSTPTQVPADPASTRQPDAEPEQAADLDPTKLVFFNVRYQHQELGDGNTVDFALLRRDVAVPRPKSWQPGEKLALLRFDLPVGNVRLGGVSTDGIGDLYTQALHVRPIAPGLLLASGLAIQMPTATEDVLGTGKWVAAPLVVPVWRLPRRTLFFTKVQDYASFAGDDDRRDVHYFAVTPTYVKSFGRRFVLLDSEGVVDWERDDEVSWKSGVALGTVIGRQRAFWVKLEAPWGEHRRFDWMLQASLVFRSRK